MPSSSNENTKNRDRAQLKLLDRWLKRVPEHEMPKGPNGRKLCRWCQQEVPPPKRTFCGPECLHEYSLRKDSQYLRRCVENRDGGICALCGLDTEKLKRIAKKLDRLDWETTEGKSKINWHGKTSKIYIKITAKYPWSYKLCHSMSMKQKINWFWEADHILEVVKGGGACGLDNIQTLCIGCHRQKTQNLLRELRGSRK